MSIIEERWAEKCDLCGKIRNGERWWEEHCAMGGAGSTFIFCFECDENRQPECVKLMGDSMARRRKECIEYWETHPEELAKHRKETEEYRKTLNKKSWFQWFKNLFTYKNLPPTFKEY